MCLPFLRFRFTSEYTWILNHTFATFFLFFSFFFSLIFDAYTKLRHMTRKLSRKSKTMWKTKNMHNKMQCLKRPGHRCEGNIFVAILLILFHFIPFWNDEKISQLWPQYIPFNSIPYPYIHSTTDNVFSSLYIRNRYFSIEQFFFCFLAFILFFLLTISVLLFDFLGLNSAHSLTYLFLYGYNSMLKDVLSILR